MVRGIWLFLLVALTARGAAGQGCTTTVLASFYDQRTTAEVETLKTEDFTVKMGDRTLPVLSSSRKFNNRLLILLQTEGAAKSDKLEDIVEMVTKQAQQAPEGKPVAFGVFAEKAQFTSGFIADPDKRIAAVSAVVEEAGDLGKQVALWDALHQALALFGPHQPGDTILLVGDPFDNASHHSASDVEKEFMARGTRLFMMRRVNGSHVERDFMWSSHELEKSTLDRLTQETGGLISLYVPPLIRFAWAGYMLEIKVPPEMNKPHKWKVEFQGPAAHIHRKTNFYYPAMLPPCGNSESASR
jgi:hypothetical protein